MTDDKKEFKFQLIVCLSYLAIIVVLILIIVDIRGVAVEYQELYQECNDNKGFGEDFLNNFEIETNDNILVNLDELGIS